MHFSNPSDEELKETVWAVSKHENSASWMCDDGTHVLKNST